MAPETGVRSGRSDCTARCAACLLHFMLPKQMAITWCRTGDEWACMLYLLACSMLVRLWHREIFLAAHAVAPSIGLNAAGAVK